MDEMSLIENDKEKYEHEIPELKSKLRSLKEENDHLLEQVCVWLKKGPHCFYGWLDVEMLCGRLTGLFRNFFTLLCLIYVKRGAFVLMLKISSVVQIMSEKLMSNH